MNNTFSKQTAGFLKFPREKMKKYCILKKGIWEAIGKEIKWLQVFEHLFSIQLKSWINVTRMTLQ